MSDSRRVLVLEDNPERIKWFKEVLDKAVVDFTADPAEAVRWMQEREYRAIFLDHDLAEPHYAGYMAGAVGTGQIAADWLGENGDKQRNALVIVHTLNDVGGQNMLAALNKTRDAARIPFHILAAFIGRGR